VTLTDVQDATSSYDCKVPGCNGEARANRGPNAYLCPAHIRDRPPASGAPRLGGLIVMPPDHIPGAPVGFEARAKRLVGVGRKLDRAITTHRGSRETLDSAMAAWREAIAELVPAQ
jgi:hypothetical protein